MKFDPMKDLENKVINSESNAVTNSNILDMLCDYSRYYGNELYLVPYTTDTYNDPIMRMSSYYIGEAYKIHEDGSMSTECTHVMVLPIMLYDESIKDKYIYKKLDDTTMVKIIYAVFFNGSTGYTSKYFRKIYIESEWERDISVNMKTSTLRQFYIGKYASKQAHAFNHMREAEAEYGKYSEMLEELRR